MGAIVGNDAMAKQAIEPGDKAFFIANCMDLFDGLDETMLEKIVRNVFGGDPASNKVFEGLPRQHELINSSKRSVYNHLITVPFCRSISHV
jgi:hypothetical protein